MAAVRALRLLDTPPEERFDRHVRLARVLADTPIAAFTIIDAERQFLKARSGIDVSETPRALSFCAHAILEPERTMVVEDARLDRRVADNPLVQGPPGIRFYVGAPVKAPTGEAVGALCVVDMVPRPAPAALQLQLADLAQGVSDMLALTEALDTLARVATTDPLTGLLNRNGLEARFAAIEASGRASAVLLLDLDGFKPINDMLGHGVGDRTLMAVAGRIRDAVGPQGESARLGSDEFAVLTAADAEPLARRILAALRAPLVIDGHRLCIGGSAGIARVGDHGRGLAEVLRAADRALHQAKDGGGGRIVTFGDDRRVTRLPGRQEIAALLREALGAPGREPFTIVWQPIVTAATGKLRSVEALLRWRQPNGVAIPPGRFVPIAEKTGLIAHLDRWVLRRACALAASSRMDVPIAVNLSPPNLLMQDLDRVVADTLEAAGLAPERLILEVTESIGISDRVAAAAAIGRLQALGVRVALDDFGEGTAGLGYLRDLAPDDVKIDRHFVAGATADPRARALLAGMVAMIKGAGATAIAEGVETVDQAAMLREIGIDAMQGWYFGTPTEKLPRQRREAA